MSASTVGDPLVQVAAPPRRSGARARWGAVLRTPVGAGAGLLLAAVLLLAVLAPILWSDEANAIDTDNALQGASAEHWVGTDSLGRDIFYRVLVATRLSVELALAATAITVVIGLVLGTAPLLMGRRGGRLVTAGVNIAVAFPGLLLALFFAVIFGVGMTGAMLAIGFAGAPAFGRLTQTLTAGVAQRDYVAAARIAGLGRFRILLRHVLPNVAEPLVVNATIGAGGALLAFAGLSFLGLGVQSPDYDWGRLLMEGLSGIYIHPEAALAPGVAIVIAGLAFNLFGEAVAKGIGLTASLGRVPLGRRGRIADQAPATDLSPEAGSDDAVLDVQDLTVTFPGPDGPVRPVRGVTFTIRRGEAVGVVGESGSGKSLTALAVGRLIEEPGRVSAGRLEFLGTDLLTGSERAHRQLLGTSFAMVFQDPMTSFNPTRRIGRQLAEVAQEHQGMTRSEALARAVDRLRAVRVPAADRRARQYPHEFSGGMRQRAMIGMGLMGSPALIVADEPTTALDVTVQRQVLDLLEAIRREDDVALLLISHDVAVVREVCDRVLVMYAGRIVEDLPTGELARARHPYTRALLATVPDMSVDLSRPLPVIPGRPVDPAAQPVGCAYAPRCPLASARCLEEDPDLAVDATGRRVACWHAGEIAADEPGRVALGTPA
ncbi:dipeptide/oligopeptide/nickel ABC transporter permease/ATP-binding protein [Petropleomorpha daqingensis]|uniref:Oligopeptide/dipeptide ABC transporter ATP-binding protein n=1 Tax=Petropleomorpha daqingensis TaxID=2026353 RepID=A0A853CDA9_9ACTN|nr:dipeptide/oligopeptide/nickel ABC transporter permease/ATP-binding protein [Petropleomorpha daqingensis]NYJ04133.1 oligopeptide/dipeptide ABC transporter ATP-binding protein [Petropleomorpha daqingensis]